MKTIFEITNGPSREELFDALRLCSEKRLIPFLVKKNEKEKYFGVIINSIQAEDGSGQSWNLTFLANKDFLSESFFVDKPKKREEHVIAVKVTFEGFRNLCESNYHLPDCRKNLVLVKAYYSTKTRKGIITVGSNEPQKCIHRIVLHNEIVDDDTVLNIVKKETGSMNILNWKVERVINYRAFVPGSEFQQAQTDTIIKVYYLRD